MNEYTVWSLTDILKIVFFVHPKNYGRIKIVGIFYNSEAKIYVWQRKFIHANYLVVTIKSI